MVTVSASPRRVVVEDVRSRRRAVGDDLDGVGRQIAELLGADPDSADGGAAADTRRVSES